MLFPPRCSGCEAPGNRWCSACDSAVEHPWEPMCALCGIPLDDSANLCEDCRRSAPKFHALRSWSVFEGPTRNALHRLKYRRDIGLGAALAPSLVPYIAALGWRADLIVPVPLGRKRLAQRGYNQVSVIARPLSMAMRIAYAPDAVARSQETRSQVGLTRAERQVNVQDAFRGNPSRVGGRTVLLIDDIATTGSTLSSCASALRAAGARDVFAFSVARAMPKHGLHAV